MVCRSDSCFFLPFFLRHNKIISTSHEPRHAFSSPSASTEAGPINKRSTFSGSGKQQKVMISKEHPSQKAYQKRHPRTTHAMTRQGDLSFSIFFQAIKSSSIFQKKTEGGAHLRPKLPHVYLWYLKNIWYHHSKVKFPGSSKPSKNPKHPSF